MQSNTRRVAAPRYTHEGAQAAQITPLQQLRRTVLACLLWEDGFYESGQTVVDRIRELVPLLRSAGKAPSVWSLVDEARRVHNLRHAPLLLCRELARIGCLPAHVLHNAIQRADEITEFMAMYWADGRTPIAKQVKLGLEQAFRKFDAYQLAKYDRDRAVKLADVMRMVRPKPVDEAQRQLWGQLLAGTLPAPDTWEVALSGGADKRATFERLLIEGKLGYLALLRNLRNMADSGVDPELVKRAILERRGADRVLPFRFVAAARACPRFEMQLDAALQHNIVAMPRLPGRTVVLVDVSGSMFQPLSAKSDLQRVDAAAALASVIHAEDLRVFTFSDSLIEVPPRRGMAGVDAVLRSQRRGGTDLGGSVWYINAQVPHDRLIVITDEQSHTRVSASVAKHAYMINVATDKNGVGYGNGWTHVDGFSEGVLRWIHAFEQEVRG